MLSINVSFGLACTSRIAILLILILSGCFLHLCDTTVTVAARWLCHAQVGCVAQTRNICHSVKLNSRAAWTSCAFQLCGWWWLRRSCRLDIKVMRCREAVSELKLGCVLIYLALMLLDSDCRHVGGATLIRQLFPSYPHCPCCLNSLSLLRPDRG
jgi:hypothetical protein